MLETPPFCLPWESRFSQTGNRSKLVTTAEIDCVHLTVERQIVFQRSDAEHPP